MELNDGFQKMNISHKINYNNLLLLFLNTFKKIFNKKIKKRETLSIIKNELFELIKVAKENCTYNEYKSLMNHKMVFDSYMYDEVKKPIEFIVIGLVAIDIKNLLVLKEIMPDLSSYLTGNKYLLNTLIIEYCTNTQTNLNYDLLLSIFDKNIIHINEIIKEALTEYAEHPYTTLTEDWLDF